MVPTRLAPLAIIVFATVSCVQGPQTTQAFGPSVRICTDGDCRTVATDTLRSALPEADRRGELQSDPDRYAGQDVATLQSAAEAGETRSAYILGQVYEFGLAGRSKNLAAAARWYESAAGNGHAWACFRLASLLEGGAAGRRDPARAFQLTSHAAQAGVAQAAFNLGMMYHTGRGATRDPSLAVRWLTQAAENGVPDAQLNLGIMYFRGDGVERQLYQALTWMRQAAKGGNHQAQKAVGRLYMTGLETMGQDLQEARSWISLAASRGDREAEAWLRQIDKALAEERAFQQQLQLQAEQTQALWASVILASLLSPPPVTYVVRYW